MLGGMTVELPPMWDDLDFNSPLSEARAAGLVHFLGKLEIGRIVDFGCGWGELLLRAVAATGQLTGRGIDRRRAYIEQGRANAAARGLAGRVDLVVGDASADVTEGVDAAICIGASQIWGGHRAALTVLRAKVPRGGRVVYGDCVWDQPPTPAALRSFDASPGDHPAVAELVDLAVELGFRPRAVGTASLQEWDAFESGYSWGFERWLRDHSDADPDAEEVRGMATDHRRRWLHGYRGVLGFAYLTLIAH